MHLAKGLEFRAVAVMACDDEIIPLQERIETVGDDADLQEVYDTERHLLYTAFAEKIPDAVGHRRMADRDIGQVTHLHWSASTMASRSRCAISRRMA
jgi:superfamily I DNA/RNA helicase